jgi:hypothetical protein
MVLEVTGMGQLKFGPGHGSSFLLPREIDISRRPRVISRKAHVEEIAPMKRGLKYPFFGTSVKQRDA